MAFSKFMDIPVYFEYLANGDDNDFVINEHTIDVKTASRNYGSVLVRCISEKGNWVLDPCDIYIAGYIHQEVPEEHYAEVSIEGWCTKEYLSTLSPVPARVGKHQNLQLDFDKINPISSIKKELKS